MTGVTAMPFPPPVLFDGCAGCGACLLTCPTHAIRPYGGELYALPELCTGCGECVEVCPVDAVTMRAVSTAGAARAATSREGER